MQNRNDHKFFLKKIRVVFSAMAVGSLFFLNQTACASEVKKNAEKTYTVDIYRTRSTRLSVADLEKKYDQSFREIAEDVRFLVSDHTDAEKDKVAASMRKRGRKISAYAKKKGNFSYLHFSSFDYPDDPVVHFTLNVVDAEDANRQLIFLPKPTKTFPDPGRLIQTFEEYNKKGIVVAFSPNHPSSDPTVDCPVDHCLWGFGSPELEKYKAIFMTETPKYRDQLITILREDKDPEKRTFAAYLLAHAARGTELASILRPSIFDSDDGVRNAVMRVFVTMMAGAEKNKQHIPNLPIQDFVKLADSPFATDRNKSLSLLVFAASDPIYLEQLKQGDLHYLLFNLELLQPNMHNPAYGILQKISGQSYGERDYAAWSAWIEKQMRG